MNKNSGFNIIELVVVVVIIGILSALAIPQYTKTVERSRQSEALTNLAAIRGAQTRYYLENGNYTNSFDNLDIDNTTNGTYFTYTVVDESANTVVARALRNSEKNPCGTTNYTINMYENGTTSKTGAGCASCSAVSCP
ncbi:MAG: type IV pilin-like G/H family protein [Candidatus Omnitrophota bacterium]|nr:type IV pilin-like G/H family protein [Candidatus Omnitrophota bacterium]